MLNFFLKSKPIICINIDPDLKYYLTNKYLEDKGISTRVPAGPLDHA